jgi:hypothetical protein
MSTAAKTSVSTRLPFWKVATTLFALNIGLLASNSAMGQASSTVGPPIIFVHGICSNPSDWAFIRNSVVTHLPSTNGNYQNTNDYIAVATGPSAGDVLFYDDTGSPLLISLPTSARLFSVAFNPNGFGTSPPAGSPNSFNALSVMQQSIKRKGDELAAVIAAVKRITGIPKVILIAHSLGGLDARSYLENLGSVQSHKQGNDSDVIEVTTIDTPHLGVPATEIQSNLTILSFLSQYVFGQCLADQSEDMNEMEPTSQVMKDLNYQTSAAGDIPRTISFDSMVNYVPLISAENFNFPLGPLYGLVGPLCSIENQNVYDDGPVCSASQDMNNALGAYPRNLSYPQIRNPAPITPFTGLCPSPHLLHELACVGTQDSTTQQVNADIASSFLQESIDVEPQQLTMALGQAHQFTAAQNNSTPVVYWMLLEDPASPAISSSGRFQPTAAGTYHVVATDQSTGKQYGIATVTVTSQSTVQPPTVATAPATLIGSDGANLNGSVNPNGSVVTAWFDYGTSSTLQSFQSTTPIQSIPSGTANVPVVYGLSGQSANTKYYYRTAASNGVTTVRDTNIFNFTTLNTLPAPTLLTPVNSSTGASVTPQLSWTTVVNAASGYRVMMSTSKSALPTDPNSDSCTLGCVLGSMGATPSTTTFTPAAGELSPATTYYWEVHGRSPTQAGNWSSVSSFTTASAVTNDFSIQVSPSSQSISQGNSATYTVATATISGTSQSVALSIGNVPSGITASFTSATVTSGGQTSLTVAASSSVATGTYTLTVIGTGTGTSHAYPISVTVTQATTGAKLQASPSSFNFSPQTVNTASSPVVISLVNAGGTALTISSLTASPGFVSSFLNGQGLPLTLQPNGYANMQVVFIPTAAGAQTGSIKLFNSTNSSPLVINLTGTGLAGPVTTGNIQVNATFNGSPWSGTVYYTVTGPLSYNGGAAPYTYYNSVPGSYTVAYSVSGPGGATFTGITPSATQPLAAGATTTYTLNFTGSNNFAVSAPQPTSAVISAGSSTQFQLGLCIVSGATQTVNLAITGLPTGATASFSSNPVTVGCSATSSVATITTAASTPPGVYSLVFIGTNQDGLSISSHPATLTVNLPPTSPTQLVSLSSAGVQGNGFSGAFFSNTNLVSSAVSSNGRYVAFDSAATDLVANDTNSQPDIFVRDTQANTTTRISVASKESLHKF